MVKKYKTRADAITALGDDALKESINGPLATLIGPKLMQLQGTYRAHVFGCN